MGYARYFLETGCFFQSMVYGKTLAFFISIMDLTYFKNHTVFESITCKSVIIKSYFSLTRCMFEWGKILVFNLLILVTCTLIQMQMQSMILDLNKTPRQLLSMSNSFLCMLMVSNPPLTFIWVSQDFHQKPQRRFMASCERDLSLGSQWFLFSLTFITPTCGGGSFSISAGLEEGGCSGAGGCADTGWVPGGGGPWCIGCVMASPWVPGGTVWVTGGIKPTKRSQLHKLH